MSKSLKDMLSAKKNATKADEVIQDEVLSTVVEAVEEMQASVSESAAIVERAAEVISELEAKVQVQDEELKSLKEAKVENGETEEVKSARAHMKSAMKSVGGDIIKGGKLQGTKANGTGFGQAGDIIVTEFSKQITERILASSDLVQFFGQETGILDFKKKVSKGGTVASWDGEYTSTVPTLVDISATGGKLTASPMVEKTVAADAFFDAYSFLEQDAMKRIAAQAATSMLNGDGVKKPLGLVKHFDKVEGLKTLETRDVEQFPVLIAAAIDAALVDVLRSAVRTVPSAYYGNARWGMSVDAFQKIYALKDAEGRSYLQYDPSNSMAYKLMGFDIVVDVTLAADAPIMFGDFDAGFKVLNVPQAIDLVANQYRIPGFMVYDITYRAAVIMGANDALVGVFLPVAGE